MSATFACTPTDDGVWARTGIDVRSRTAVGVARFINQRQPTHHQAGHEHATSSAGRDDHGDRPEPTRIDHLNALDGNRFADPARRL
ncbi:hypothetical protein ACFYO0_39750 [Streptomyces sp. NPDC006365]|uniref:hypothetical protein n=1 Tax=Streptomyces sp. NPDC006365 TaxID=3364744 RepID=UPI0036B7AA55